MCGKPPWSSTQLVAQKCKRSVQKQKLWEHNSEHSESLPLKKEHFLKTKRVLFRSESLWDKKITTEVIVFLCTAPCDWHFTLENIRFWNECRCLLNSIALKIELLYLQILSALSQPTDCVMIPRTEQQLSWASLSNHSRTWWQAPVCEDYK